MTIHSRGLDLNRFLAECDSSCLEKITSYLDTKSMQNFLLSCKSVRIAMEKNYSAYPGALENLKIKILINCIANKPGEKELSQWLVSACEQGNLLRCKALVVSDRFSEVSKDCLGHCLVVASKQGYLAIVQEFITSKRTSEISLSDLFISIIEAEKYRYSNIVENLAEHYYKLKGPNLRDETLTAAFLEDLLVTASKRGCLQAVEHFLFEKLPYRFNNDELTTCLTGAAKYGYLDVVQMLMNRTYFSMQYLEQALIEAAKYGRLDLIKAFVDSNEFSKISSSYLDKVMEKAAEYGHLNIIAVFIGSNRFAELFLYGGLARISEKIILLIKSSAQKNESFDCPPIKDLKMESVKNIFIKYLRDPGG